jgi:hypothetical protein
MAVTMMLYLFGKPGMELNEGGEVTAQELRDLGQSLNERLQEAATIVEKLSGAGWEVQMALYDVLFSHPYIETATHAEEQLLSLGIDPERLAIDEWEDEDEGWVEEDDEEAGTA